MKKSVAGIFAAAVLSFGSCGSYGSDKTDRMLDDYEGICKEMMEATRRNDVNKINEVQDKAREFQQKYSDFEDSDMTLQQKERFIKITTEMIDAAMGNAMHDIGHNSEVTD